jgi:hypothetical protein
VAPGQIGHLGTRLVLLEHGNELLLGEPFAFHLGTSLESSFREIPYRAWIELRE